MVHVQERQLIVFLAQNEEERIGELQHLGEVVPPDGIDDLRRTRRSEEKTGGKSVELRRRRMSNKTSDQYPNGAKLQWK